MERADRLHDNFATFDMGTIVLALYPLPLLTDEAATGQAGPEPGWNGITIAPQA